MIIDWSNCTPATIHKLFKMWLIDCKVYTQSTYINIHLKIQSITTTCHLTRPSSPAFHSIFNKFLSFLVVVHLTKWLPFLLSLNLYLCTFRIRWDFRLINYMVNNLPLMMVMKVCRILRDHRIHRTPLLPHLPALSSRTTESRRPLPALTPANIH